MVDSSSGILDFISARLVGDAGESLGGSLYERIPLIDLGGASKEAPLPLNEIGDMLAAVERSCHDEEDQMCKIKVPMNLMSSLNVLW